MKLFLQRSSAVEEEMAKLVQPKLFAIGELYNMDSFQIDRLRGFYIILCFWYWIHWRKSSLVLLGASIAWHSGRGQTLVSVNSFFNAKCNCQSLMFLCFWTRMMLQNAARMLSSFSLQDFKCSCLNQIDKILFFTQCIQYVYFASNCFHDRQA